MRQATGFLVGSELRRVLGFEVGVRQGDQLWSSHAATTPYELDVSDRPIGAGPDIALIINVAANAADVAAEWIQNAGLPVGTILTVTPTQGAGPSALTSPVAANSLAVAVRDLARRHSRAENMHLFLIGPIGLAILLGHHWNRVTTTHVYEHLGVDDYAHAFTVDA